LISETKIAHRNTLGDALAHALMNFEFLTKIQMKFGRLITIVEYKNVDAEKLALNF
jgi:hypothetical protein